MEDELNIAPKEAKIKQPKVVEPEPIPFELDDLRPSAPKVEEGPAIPLQDAAPDSVGPWVQYNGIATLRIMDANAWHSAGVKSDKYVEWNYLNNKRVPVSHFTDAELAYLIGRDGRFSKVE